MMYDLTKLEEKFHDLQSFPASGSFPVSEIFASGGQSIGASPSGISPSNVVLSVLA